jgi:hypothetical protein
MSAVAISDPLLTYGAAASLISISKRHFRRLYVDSGVLPIVWVSERAPRVRLSDLNECLLSRTITVHQKEP